MTSTPAPSAPLEAHDPDRARALKAKIRDRVSDVRRHLIALRVAMAEFGEDFDLDEFRAAYDTDEPARLNQVKAVERGVDQLWNYIAELTSFGLELAEVRRRGDELNARPRSCARCAGSGCSGPSALGAWIACASCAVCSCSVLLLAAAAPPFGAVRPHVRRFVALRRSSARGATRTRRLAVGNGRDGAAELTHVAPGCCRSSRGAGMRSPARPSW